MWLYEAPYRELSGTILKVNPTALYEAAQKQHEKWIQK
jgi:hypothetical protein